MAEWVVGLLAGYVIFGAVLHRIYLLLWPPPDSLLPAEGTVIRSEAEGFTQRVLKMDGERLWVQLTLDPHAPGPPPHVHTGFAERFRVASGRVHFDLERETKSAGEGEEVLVLPGRKHRLRNTTDETAVVQGPLDPEYALPRRFGLFLMQAYGLFDESPENARPPRAILQMSFWSPLFDIWLPAPPIVVQRVLFALVRPIALLLGYRPWYGRFRSQQVVHL